jgi:hypothetical protein
MEPLYSGPFLLEILPRVLASERNWPVALKPIRAQLHLDVHFERAGSSPSHQPAELDGPEKSGNWIEQLCLWGSYRAKPLTLE